MVIAMNIQKMQKKAILKFTSRLIFSYMVIAVTYIEIFFFKVRVVAAAAPLLVVVVAPLLVVVVAPLLLVVVVAALLLLVVAALLLVVAVTSLAFHTLETH
jgi:hypothetical protein